MNYWLVKSEPSKYSWDDMVRDGRDHWDGIRNYQARNNLKAMREGDLVLFYHSVVEKAVRGITRVVREFYPDPTTDDERWVVVDLQALEPLGRPVTLAEIKANPDLAEIALVRQSRLSVVPLTKAEYGTIVKLARTSA